MIYLYVGAAIASAIFVFSLVRYCPLYVGLEIEGVYREKRHDTELFRGTPLTIYYFENYCKRCMEAGVSDRYSWRGCNETVPSAVWHLGQEPQPGESVRMMVYFSLSGHMVLVRWVRTDFKPDPEKVIEVSKATWQRGIASNCNCSDQ